MASVMSLILSLVLIAGRKSAAAGSDAFVDTPLGRVRGYSSESLGVESYLGIPYAEPPVGARRFRRAVPKAPWSPKTLDATIYGPQCFQTGMDANLTSEDCLFVNVFRPTAAAASRPVFVFIHGGGFTHGAGSLYNMTRLVSGGDVVGVTLNYRLAALGQFASEEVQREGNATVSATGGLNFLNDQITALEWVQTNIASFGGDPANVTVFGESAGGISVCMLSASDAAAGLFIRAGIESGACIGPWGPRRSAFGLAMSDLFMKSLNASSVEELRALRPEQLAESEFFDYVGPSLDGRLLTQHPAAIFARKSGLKTLHPRARVLLGSNTLDGLEAAPFLSYRGQLPRSAEELAAAFEYYFGSSPSMRNSIAEAYDASQFSDNATLAFIEANSDACVVCPTQGLAAALANGPDKLRVHLYRFGFAGEGHAGLSPHASELSLVFGYPDPKGQFPYNETLSQTMRKWWDAFARGEQPWPDLGNGTWPITFMNISASPLLIRGAYNPRCDAWTPAGADPAMLARLQCQFCIGNKTYAAGRVPFCE